MNCTIDIAKTKALISFAVTAKLICVFVFAYDVTLDVDVKLRNRRQVVLLPIIFLIKSISLSLFTDILALDSLFLAQHLICFYVLSIVISFFSACVVECFVCVFLALSISLIFSR